MRAQAGAGFAEEPANRAPRAQAGAGVAEDKPATRAPLTATYRVQVRPSFDLDAAAGLAGYLARLGVSHLYSAPQLAATPGSEHGYDVVDHSATSPALGGDEARQRLVAALRRAGLGLVVDIVPNHAGIAVPAANPAWWDVLRRGRDSPYAHWFDIDWTRPRILLPVLADTPDALDDLRLEEGELRYFEHRFPLADGSGNGTPKEAHDRQHYELASWRRANEELNYRRFFAINELAGLRVEDETVFAATHREILRWVGRGDVDGIRVDHPDGLRDPAGYLRRLRAAAPDTWLVVEKILEAGETLDGDWPVDGTTGYEALREVCGVFVDPAGEPPAAVSWPDAAHEAKQQVTQRLFGAELRRLAALTGLAPDRPDVRATLAEVAAAFDVYRSYLPIGRSSLDRALASVRATRGDLASTVDKLAARLADPADELAQRFQQLTGAVMAKGVEDTASYRWTRFVALNEVGGDPGRFGVPVAEFHAAAAARQERWPRTMTTLSTHDTKRSEDVRARLAVLSELPDDWADTMSRWHSAAVLPDPSVAALLWQTVAGTWPIERDRLQAYLRKAAREANVSTSWADPDDVFERRLHDVVDRVYDDAALRTDVDRFVARVTPPGWSNSLGQKLLQLTMPGVPDVYQGTELWDNSLVDPDNRRPVDFAEREALLARLDTGWLPPVDASGAAKLLVVSRALRLRRSRPFTGYRAVYAVGPASEHVVAFDRGGVVAVATRLPVGLAARGGWAGTTLDLPPGDWTDILTGRPVVDTTLASIMDTYPVALLAPR
jgi:(1->4)-alpha-D-glucan 1-alpha-D-glucosylmutase